MRSMYGTAGALLAISLLGMSWTGGAVLAGAEANLTGTWKMSIPELKRNPTVQLVQEGTKLSGTYRGPMGNFPLTGAIDGENRVKFTVDFRSAASRLPRRIDPEQALAQFTGSVKGNVMQGTAQVPQIEPGRTTEWTAAR